ncbi:MAG TPA: hypothetical protein PLA50_03535 [Bacteroidia bacterium]|nr:hypothetical protein [Bacteroidia bacterium]
MATVDINLLVSGFLRHAAKQADARAWLDNLHGQTVAAVAAGDRFVTTTAFDGTSSTMERRFEAQQLLSVLEICLARLDSEEEGEATSGTVRVGDFSGRRSEWG